MDGTKTLGGVFGVPSNFFAVVEAQARGSLHLHALVWLEGVPQLDLLTKWLLAAAKKPRPAGEEQPQPAGAVDDEQLDGLGADGFELDATYREKGALYAEWAHDCVTSTVAKNIEGFAYPHPSNSAMLRSLDPVTSLARACREAEAITADEHLTEPDREAAVRELRRLQLSLASAMQAYDDDFVRHLRAILDRVQMHKCTACCKKYCDSCRFGFTGEPLPGTSQPTKPLTEGGIKLDEAGFPYFETKRNDPLVNNYNPYMAAACCCNTDCQLVLTSGSARAAMFYIASYVTKRQLSSYEAEVCVAAVLYANR
jgi:hypothetical protein